MVPNSGQEFKEWTRVQARIGLIVPSLNVTIFLSCTNFRTIEVISALERELKKPVISSNAVTLWDALRRLKIKEPVVGYGELFNKI